MDNRRRIPIKDVKQIAYEAGLWAIDVAEINRLKKLLGEPLIQGFEETFNSWINDRIQMVIDRQ